METLPSVGPRLDTAALDESIYSVQSFAKQSPFHASGTADEHFEGAEAASRDWGSPLSEPGSPRGSCAAKTEVNCAIAGGGGGGSSSMVQAKVCTIKRTALYYAIGASMIVRLFVVVCFCGCIQVWFSSYGIGGPMVVRFFVCWSSAAASSFTSRVESMRPSKHDVILCRLCGFFYVFVLARMYITGGLCAKG